MNTQQIRERAGRGGLPDIWRDEVFRLLDEIERLTRVSNAYIAERQEIRGLLPACLEEFGPGVLEGVHETVAEVERLKSLFGNRFHLDAVCGSCGGPLDAERDAICCRCTDGDIADMEARQWKELTAECERLQANVDRLPRDAEGNPIFLLDVRYRKSGYRVVIWKIGVEYVFGQGGLAYEPSSLYGSPEAAEQARAGR